MTEIPPTAIEAAAERRAAILRAAEELAGPPICRCPVRGDDTNPYDSRARCQKHGSGPWPTDTQEEHARRILEASGLPTQLQAAQARITELEGNGKVTRPWRVGRKVGRTIYAQLRPEPSDSDPLIGVMDTPALALAAVTARAELQAALERAERAEAERDAARALLADSAETDGIYGGALRDLATIVAERDQLASQLQEAREIIQAVANREPGVFTRAERFLLETK